MTKEALENIENDITFKNKKSTVVFNKDWHKGVVGIVASRLIEHHFRPTIVLTESNGKITGSARTVNHFNLYEALEKCDHLLEQWGGHHHAAGLTLSKDKLNEFIAYFDEVVQETLSREAQIQEQWVDVEIDFNTLFLSDEDRMKIPRFKRILDQFEPFGPGNMKPLFLAKNVFSKQVKILKDTHLKLTMFQPNIDLQIEGIGFNLGHKSDEVALGIPYDVVFTLENNVWMNRTTLQLNIKDIRAAI